MDFVHSKLFYYKKIGNKPQLSLQWENTFGLISKPFIMCKTKDMFNEIPQIKFH